MPGQMPAQSPPQQSGQGAGGAEQAIQQIQAGFQMLGKMMQAAGQQMDPADIKLFQQAVQATDNFVQALTGPAEGSEDKAPSKGPGGPMPMEANAGAKPPAY